MPTILKCLSNLVLVISLVLISSGSYAAVVKKHGAIFVKNNSRNTLIYNSKKNIYTINEKERNLTILPHTSNQSRFYYNVENKTKSYTISGIIENSNGQIIKIGFLSYFKKNRYNVNECNSKISTDYLEKISSIQPAVFTQDNISEECKSILLRDGKSKLEKSFTNFLNPNKSFLFQCLKEPKNRAIIDDKTSLSIDVNNFLAKFYQEHQQLMEGKSGFKVSCAADDSAKYTAKYDEKKKEIVFPVSNRRLKETAGCDSLEYDITHEFAHHSGIKAESAIDELMSICSKGSGSEEINKCLAKTDIKDGSPAAIMQEIEESIAAESRKDRAETQKKLQESAPAKLETISKTESIELAKLADNSKYTDYNDAPKAEAQKIEQKLEPIAVKMEQNLANVSKSVDSALGIASETAYAESNDSSELASSSRGSYTTSNYAGTSSSSSGSDSSFSKREAGSANIRTTSNRNPASFSKLKMNGNTQEYVVEEILADKYGLSKSEVQKISNDIRSRNPRGNAPSANLAGNNSNEISSSSAGSSAPESPAIGATGGSSGIGSLGGGVNTQRTAARPRGNSTGGSSARSPSSTASPVSGDEVVGLDYRNVKTRYRDQEFVNEITNSNIRILIPSLKKRIGSTEKDATIYVDTGTSLLRKK